MATIEKRGDYQYRVRIRKKGWPAQAKTFTYKKDAEAWAREVEAAMGRGDFEDRSEAEKHTLRETLKRYQQEVTPTKKSKKRETARIERLMEELPFIDYVVTNIGREEFAKFRDDRRAEGVVENTIRLDLSLLSHLYTVARKDWGWPIPNPVQMIRLPKNSRKRDRRLEEGEEEYLLKAMAEVSEDMVAVIQLALETGMRQGELKLIEWSDVNLNKRYIHLDDTKSGDPRNVPLSTRAIEILGLLGETRGAVFKENWYNDYVNRRMQKACERERELYEKDVGYVDDGFLVDLIFHDFRHEAASRCAKLLQAQELAKMFGWKTLQMAMRYYHPRAEEIALKLG